MTSQIRTFAAARLWGCTVMVGAAVAHCSAQGDRIDQEFQPANDAGGAVDAAVSRVTARAQTFTMESSGTLAGIEWFLNREDGDESATRFTIHRTTAAGVPDDNDTIFTG